jgi:hypothetical protein
MNKKMPGPRKPRNRVAEEAIRGRRQSPPPPAAFSIYYNPGGLSRYKAAAAPVSVHKVTNFMDRYCAARGSNKKTVLEGRDVGVVVNTSS